MVSKYMGLLFWGQGATSVCPWQVSTIYEVLGYEKKKAGNQDILGSSGLKWVWFYFFNFCNSCGIDIWLEERGTCSPEIMLK